jgi:adenylate cyclase
VTDPGSGTSPQAEPPPGALAKPTLARRPSFRPKARAGLEALKLWQRFHVKVTVLYGALAFLTLALLTTVFYESGVKLAMGGIRTRLAGTTVAIAQGFATDSLRELRTKEDRGGPAYRALQSSASAISEAEKDLLSIYVLVPTEKPGVFRFAFDFVAPGKRTVAPADVGQEYDAAKNLTLQKGMSEAVVETEISSDAWGDSLSAYAPVTDREGKHVALVGIDGDANAIRKMKTDILELAILLSLLAGGLLGVAGFFVGRGVREPLVRVIDAATSVSGGHFETRVALARRDEFGILGEHFDDMAAGLEERDRIRTTFGRYVSEDIAKRVLSGSEGARMGGEVREVTVLFSDLRGYSTISETLSPTATVEFLNEYLSVMNAEIDKAGGCIIEFLGDAILAVFGAPNELEGHPEKAVRCAMAMRQGLAAFNERMNREGRAPWQAKGMAGLGQRIGIHTGAVVAGNLGSKVRVKYAVIGDAVNVASRCEGLNKVLGTEVLCTSATWELLPADLQAQLTDRGAHDVKGRANKVSVYAA